MSKSNFIETKKAIDDITLAIDKQISSANELNSKVVQLNSNYAKLPSEYTKSLNDIATANKKVVDSEDRTSKALERTRLAEIKLQQDREKAFDKYQSELNKKVALEEKSRLSEIKLQQEREKSVDKITKQNQIEINSLEKTSGAYNRVQLFINKLTASYNDLAVKKQLGIKLSKSEEVELYKLTEQLNLYRGTLKKVDSDVNLNQRNVGNYKGVFQDVAAAGNSFTNLLSTIFSKVRVLAYVLPGIGIAGIFGLALDPIFNFIKGLDSVQKAFGLETNATKAAKKALEEKTRAEAEQNQEIANTVSAEQTKAKILFENVKNEGITMKDRITNFQELQQHYKQYLGDLTLQQALAGDTAIAEERLNEALAKRGLALAIQSLLQKNAEKQIEQELKYGTALKETTDASNLYDTAQQGATKTSSKLRMVREAELDNLDNLRKTEKANAETSTYIGKTTTTQVRTLANERAKALIPIKEEEKALLNLYKIYAPYLDFTKKDKETKREQIKSIKLLKLESLSLTQSLENEIKFYEELRDKSNNTGKEFRNFDAIVKALKQSLDLLKDPSKYITADVSGLKAQQELIKAHELGWKESLKAQNAYAAGFTQNFIDNAGFKTTFDILNGQILGFGSNAKVTAIAIMESFQEMFNFISQASQANFDAEYKRLDDQKNTAIAFAGDSEAAKKEIDQQTEKRKKDIARREAKAQKDIAIFNILTDTAQAIIGLWAKPGFPAAIPLAAIVGALGAAQLAAVSSAPLPQYFKGTDNAPSGLAWTNEKGAEIHTDKHGNIKDLGTKKGAQLTMMDQGDKVFTASESQRMLQDMELNNLLSSNGIIMNNNIQGISDAQVDKIVSAVNNAPTSEIIMDELGFRKLQRRNGIKEQVLNARFRTKITPR